MPTPTDLLFIADNRLRDAANRYHDATLDEHVPDEEVEAAEAGLRQAARDYSRVADIVDTAVGVIDSSRNPRFVGLDDVIARITAPTAAPKTEPVP